MRIFALLFIHGYKTIRHKVLTIKLVTDMEISALQWPDDINCAVTVCDINGVIKYMNRRAKETFAAHGDLIGKNLFECHSEESRAKIRHMLATGDSNAYTISKNGQRKVIYQTPWRLSLIHI